MKRIIFLAAVLFFCGQIPFIQAQMIDRSPSRVQTTLKVNWKVIGSVAPRSVHEIGEQNWTLGCETMDRDYIYWDTYKEYVAPLGIKRIRLQAGWAKTETVKGKYNFTWLDNIINDAQKRGLVIWLETDYGNPIYEGGGGADLAAGFPTSKEALAAWDRWVEALAKRYEKNVWAWAMWNEPDIGTPKKSVEAIGDFNIRTAEIIKKIIPNAKIGALSLARNKPEYLDQCLKHIADKGKLDLFRWVIYHGYTKNPDDAYDNVEKMKAVVAKYSSKLKLWQGENGCPSERASKFALSNHDWTELTQAKWDARRMLGDLGHDVMSSVFTICDFDHSGREINRKGLLKINDKKNLAKVKTAYYTVQNIVALFDGRLKRQKNYQCVFTPEKKDKSVVKNDKPITWFAYRDAQAKQDLLVFWNGNQFPVDDNITENYTVSIKNGLFNDPVWIDLITGKIYEIPQKDLKIGSESITVKNVPVYDAPVVLVDRQRAGLKADQKK